MLIRRAINIENASFASFHSRLNTSFGGQRKRRKFGQRNPGDSPNPVGLPTCILQRCGTIACQMNVKERLLFGILFLIQFYVQGQTNDLYQSNVADLGDIKLQYMNFGGEGPTLIWIQDFHNYFDGIYRDTTYYLPLKELAADYHVIAPIRRGYGKSTDTAWGYDVATQSNDLIRLMDLLGIEKAVFFGRVPATQDMTWIAEHYPERVLALIYDGNPILLAGCYDRNVIEFVENWSIIAPEFERHKQKAIVLSRLSWRPHFLNDSAYRIDIPTLRFIDSNYNWPDPNRGVLESGFLEEWIRDEIPGREEEVSYLRTLLQDSVRLKQLHERLIQCDPSEAIEQAMQRTFGDNLKTIYPVEVNLAEDGLLAYFRWKIQHIRAFRAMIEE
jgi:pimeloyl-ACP methyl ester carboxylesterase